MNLSIYISCLSFGSLTAKVHFLSLRFFSSHKPVFWPTLVWAGNRTEDGAGKSRTGLSMHDKVTFRITHYYLDPDMFLRSFFWLFSVSTGPNKTQCGTHIYLLTHMSALFPYKVERGAQRGCVDKGGGEGPPHYIPVSNHFRHFYIWNIAIRNIHWTAAQRYSTAKQKINKAHPEM